MADENEIQGENKTPQTVPYEEFSKARKERKEALEARKSIEAQLAELQTKLGRVTELETAVASFQSREAEWTNERTMLEHGLMDGEAREVARLFYGKVPEADRPALGDWLGTLKADPAKAPKALAAYLGSPVVAEAKAETKQAEVETKTQAAGLPKSNVGAKQTAPMTGPLSAESIEAMDLETYKAHRAQILKPT